MNRFELISDKIPDWNMASKTVKGWQVKGEKIVFTNGCFDILHLGHLKYLAEASDLGHKLIIGLNSDASITRLKGKGRPIHDLPTRSHMLAALTFVDLIVVFNENTPLELIKTLNPDVLVKGGDWAVDQVVGADYVISNGGEVTVLPFVEGYSTTAVEQKIINEYKKNLNQD